MSVLSIIHRNETVEQPRPFADLAALVAAVHAVEDQFRMETVPERRRRWERARNRQLSLIITQDSSIDWLDLTAEQEDGEVVVGILFTHDNECRRFRVRLEELDQDAQTAVQLALFASQLVVPVPVAVS